MRYTKPFPYVYE